MATEEEIRQKVKILLAKLPERHRKKKFIKLRKKNITDENFFDTYYELYYSSELTSKYKDSELEKKTNGDKNCDIFLKHGGEEYYFEIKTVLMTSEEKNHNEICGKIHDKLGKYSKDNNVGLEVIINYHPIDNLLSEIDGIIDECIKTIKDGKNYQKVIDIGEYFGCKDTRKIFECNIKDVNEGVHITELNGENPELSNHLLDKIMEKLGREHRDSDTLKMCQFPDSKKNILVLCVVDSVYPQQIIDMNYGINGLLNQNICDENGNLGIEKLSGILLNNIYLENPFAKVRVNYDEVNNLFEGTDIIVTPFSVQ